MYIAKIKAKKGKQGSTLKTPKKVRCSIITLNNPSISEVLALLHAYAGRPSSRPQVKVEQITVRFAESYQSMPQVSSSPTPQRKLLRLKNSPNKRPRVERLHTKSKSRNNKNR